MATEVIPVIIGTSVTVGGAIAGLATWAFKAVIAKEVAPTLIQLTTEASALTREFAAFREVKDEERRETRQILSDLDKIVRDHETRITVLEQPVPRGRGR